MNIRIQRSPGGDPKRDFFRSSCSDNKKKWGADRGSDFNQIGLIIYGFTSRSRIFHSYGNVTITGEGLQNLGPCSVLRAFEQGGIFIVPHLLWHGTSVYPFSSKPDPHRACILENLFESCIRYIVLGLYVCLGSYICVSICNLEWYRPEMITHGQSVFGCIIIRPALTLISN
jgi:hypothetical protein